MQPGGRKAGEERRRPSARAPGAARVAPGRRRRPAWWREGRGPRRARLGARPARARRSAAVLCVAGLPGAPERGRVPEQHPRVPARLRGVPAAGGEAGARGAGGRRPGRARRRGGGGPRVWPPAKGRGLGGCGAGDGRPSVRGAFGLRGARLSALGMLGGRASRLAKPRQVSGRARRRGAGPSSSSTRPSLPGL